MRVILRIVPWTLLWIVTISALSAQDAPFTPDAPKPTLSIQGVVLDAESHTPIPGASLFITAVVPTGAENTMDRYYGKDTSGPGGEFQAVTNFAPTVAISAQAKGYQGGQKRVTGIASDQSRVYVEVALLKNQTISGVLVDEETRKPLVGLKVDLIGSGGDPEFIISGGVPQSAKTVTAADGSFHFDDVSRSEFRVRITDKPAPVIVEIPAKALEQAGALDPPEGAMSYGTVVLPPQGADPIKVGAAPADLGEIRLSKARLQNLTGLAAPCEEGSQVQIMLGRSALNVAAGMLATQDIVCGSGFQILNVPEGTYTVTAMQGFPKRRWVAQTIDAHARSPLHLNLASYVSLQIGVELEGGTTEDLPTMRLELTPENRLLRAEDPTFDRKGAFEATLYPDQRYFLNWILPANYYLKRMSFNGSGLPDTYQFTSSTAALSQLSMVVSNRAASIEVHLTSGGNPVSARQMVYLVRDGIAYSEFSHSMQHFFGITDASGKAVFGSLPPGTYRAMTVAPDKPAPTIESTFQAMLADTARQSAPVTVDEGQAASIILDTP